MRRAALLAAPMRLLAAGAHLFGALTLAPQPAPLLAGRRKTAVDAPLVGPAADPVNLRIGHDYRMVRVYQDNLVPLVAAVGSDPVGVEHFQVREFTCGPLLGNHLQRLGYSNLGDAGALGAASALDGGLAHAPAPDTSACHHEALLGAKAQLTRPVEPRRPFDTFYGFFPTEREQSLALHGLDGIARAIPRFPDIGVD